MPQAGGLEKSSVYVRCSGKCPECGHGAVSRRELIQAGRLIGMASDNGSVGRGRKRYIQGFTFIPIGLTTPGA